MDKWLVKVKHVPCGSGYWRVCYAKVYAASKRHAKAKAEEEVYFNLSDAPYKIKAIKAIKLLEGE